LVWEIKSTLRARRKMLDSVRLYCILLLGVFATLWFLNYLLSTADWGRIYLVAIAVSAMGWAMPVWRMRRAGKDADTPPDHLLDWDSSSVATALLSIKRVPYRLWVALVRVVWGTESKIALLIAYSLVSAGTGCVLMPLTAFANQKFDSSTVEWRRTEVVATRPSRYRRRAPDSAAVIVADWSRQGGTRMIYVEDSIRKKVAAGTHAFEVATKPGALGAEWYWACRTVPLAGADEADSAP